ncbi:MAG: hypothetical protein MZU97_12000 [Bacillus subtilis]|nr:hypothetical protein [Bacillus subtilis]
MDDAIFSLRKSPYLAVRSLPRPGILRPWKGVLSQGPALYGRGRPTS